MMCSSIMGKTTSTADSEHKDNVDKNTNLPDVLIPLDVDEAV